ncbi:hypothetical protein [Evtepia gabavorous]|uniref:hypothetical protein n=1 Tax=Evtepia gabavorous TaxID=2211183 RepID=UPI003A90D88A
MERSQKLCATFWGFPVTNSSVLSLLKGKNISVPSAAVLLLDLRGHPPITYSEKRQICAPYYNLDTIPPSILSFSLFSCTLYKARKKGSNHLQIKSISSASRQIRPYPHKEMFAHPPEDGAWKLSETLSLEKGMTGYDSSVLESAKKDHFDEENVGILEKIEDNKAVLSRTYDSFLAARDAVQQIDVETGNYIALLS